MNATTTRLAQAALLALSVTAFVFSFPPHQFRLLPWLALVPLFLVLRRARTESSAAAMAAVWALFAACGIAAWLPAAIAGYWQQPFLFGLGLLVSATVLTGSLQYALFAAACRLRAPSDWPSPIFVAAAWVTAELGRCRLFGGNPWGLMGYSLAPPAASSGIAWSELPVQIAELGGVYAVSFVLVTFNSAVADLVASLATRGSGRSAAVRSVAIAGTLLIGSIVYGHQRVTILDEAAASLQDVAIVQGNVNLGTTWRPELHGRHFDLYLDGTAAARARSPKPQLVVWPENAMSFFAEDEPLYRQSLARALAGSTAEVLGGGPSHTPEKTPRYFNSAFVFSADGEILSRYDKGKLLPFSEYFPFGSIAFLRRSFGRVREFTPGSQLDPLPTSVGRAGILICNEAMFGEIAADRVRAGAEFLVNPSNDTWTGDEVYSMNHLAIGQIRAIETRRFLVRASTSGPSAFVDPAGRVRAISSMNQFAVLHGKVAAASEVTLFVRFGDAFALACAIAVVVLTLNARRRSFLMPSPSP